MTLKIETANTVEKTKRRNSSRIRDHLANERTYLAWMRSAIALMGFGVLIARLRMFQPPLPRSPSQKSKVKSQKYYLKMNQED
jgi:putative membrane protein